MFDYDVSDVFLHVYLRNISFTRKFLLSKPLFTPLFKFNKNTIVIQ